MPTHMVRDHIAAGRLKVLDLKEKCSADFAIHIVHERGRPPGRAGRWLMDRIRRRIPQCVGHGLATKPISQADGMDQNLSTLPEVLTEGH
ncbi:MAG: hypothetical protein ABJP87_13600, partial [Bauldia litoralis]